MCRLEHHCNLRVFLHNKKKKKDLSVTKEETVNLRVGSTDKGALYQN